MAGTLKGVRWTEGSYGVTAGKVYSISQSPLAVDSFEFFNDFGTLVTANVNRADLVWEDGTAAGVKPDAVNHPSHYGGAGNPYEAVKIVEALGLGFNLGNLVKYVSRAGKKTPDALEDLKKAAWYLAREIKNLEAACQK